MSGTYTQNPDYTKFANKDIFYKGVPYHIKRVKDWGVSILLYFDDEYGTERPMEVNKNHIEESIRVPEFEEHLPDSVKHELDVLYKNSASYITRGHPTSQSMRDLEISKQRLHQILNNVQGGKKPIRKSLDKCTVEELKARAAKRGIKITGLKKAEIIVKLRK